MEPNKSTPLFPQPTLFSSEYMSKLGNNGAGTIAFCSLQPNSQPVGTISKTPGSSSNDLFQASGTTSTSFNFNTLPPLGLGQSSHNFGQLSTLPREFGEPSGALSRLKTANPVIPSVATPLSIFSSLNPTIKREFGEPSVVPTESKTANPMILSAASPFPSFSSSNPTIKREFGERSGVPTGSEAANLGIPSVAPFSSYSPSNSTGFGLFVSAAPNPFAPTAFGLFAPFPQSNAQIKTEPNGSSALPATTEGTLQLPKPSLKFDQNGDLQLCVGTNDAKKEMLVDSRALCRASPILRKKLAETKSQGGHWHLKFPDDQAEAFSILMDMVHGQFVLTPKYPSIEQLYQVVVLANKYDMFQTLRPIATRWSVYDLSKCADFNDTTKLLFVAWHMGNASFFKHIIESITENVCTDRDGNLTVGPSCPERIENYTGIDVVENVITTIQQHRILRLSTIREECRQLANALLIPIANDRSRVHHSVYGHKGWPLCQERLLARLMSAAKEWNMMPYFISECPQSNTVLSIAQLIMNLNYIEKKMIAGLQCNPMRQTLNSIKNTLPQSLLTEYQIKYLGTQGIKTGLSTT